MRSRTFLLAVSAGFLLVTVLAYLWHRAFPQPGDGQALLIAGLTSVLFAVGAWAEGPAGGAACPRCGGSTMAGLPFCAACGATFSGPASR